MPVIDLSAYKPVPATLGDANQIANGMQAIQNVVNGIDNLNFAAGKIFDPAKVMQNAAVDGDAMVWDNTNSKWVPASAMPATSVKPSSYKMWDSVDAGVTLPAASIATPTLPLRFNHLRIVATLWSDQVGPQDVLMTINSDVTNANYLRRLVDGGTSMGVSGASDRICGMIAGRSGSAPTASEILIPNYSAARVHTYRAFSGYVDATPIAHTYDGFVLYSVAAAITTLAFSPNAGLLITGTRITVYGEA